MINIKDYFERVFSRKNKKKREMSNKQNKNKKKKHFMKGKRFLECDLRRIEF